MEYTPFPEPPKKPAYARPNLLLYSIYGVMAGCALFMIYRFLYSVLPMGHASAGCLSFLLVLVVTPVLYIAGLPWSILLMYLFGFDLAVAPGLGASINVLVVFVLVGLVKDHRMNKME